MITSIDLFEALKIKFGEAEAKIVVERFEQTDRTLAEVVEKVVAVSEVKLEKAFEVQAKVYKDDIKGIKELMIDKFAAMDDKFATKTDLANLRADTIKWMFIFWATGLTILGSLITALVFKLK